MKLQMVFLTMSLLMVALSGCIDTEDVYSDQERFMDDLEVIDAYLTENNIQAQIDPSGIRYVVHEQGTGMMPFKVDSVTIDIAARVLSEDQAFQTEVDSKKRWSRLLPGATIALNQIQEGGSVTAYIPSYYAYGQQEIEGVPANSILILELGLDQVHDVRLMKQITEIENFLSDKGIDATVHPSGIRYVIEKEGTGKAPNLSSEITVNYAGRLLGETTDFDAGENISFPLEGLISGWKIILPLVKEGGSVTMYLPSVFGYGVAGSGSKVPQNAILIFDMDLIRVESF